MADFMTTVVANLRSLKAPWRFMAAKNGGFMSFCHAPPSITLAMIATTQLTYSNKIVQYRTLKVTKTLETCPNIPVRVKAETSKH